MNVKPSKSPRTEIRMLKKIKGKLRVRLLLERQIWWNLARMLPYLDRIKLLENGKRDSRLRGRKTVGMRSAEIGGAVVGFHFVVLSGGGGGGGGELYFWKREMIEFLRFPLIDFLILFASESGWRECELGGS